MANSYTDIHVDPSGTCVYYHVKEGRKIFYVAPPTERNLEIYKSYEGSDPPEKWIVEELFDELQRVQIKQGYTTFIPAGYIHAVYTPEDSIVFGGNFLMDGHIDRHFEMTAVEERALDFGHIGVENTFPNLENVMWKDTDKGGERETATQSQGEVDFINQVKMEDLTDVETIEITAVKNALSYAMRIVRREATEDSTDENSICVAKVLWILLATANVLTGLLAEEVQVMVQKVAKDYKVHPETRSCRTRSLERQFSCQSLHVSIIFVNKLSIYVRPENCGWYLIDALQW